MQKEKLFTSKQIAGKLGITETELHNVAFENGLINEDGTATTFAIENGLMKKGIDVENEYIKKNKMIQFEINKNGKDGFKMIPQDFIQRCNELQVSILDKIGENGSLPDEVDSLNLMMLTEFDEVLEYYYTLKFLCREYYLDLDEETENTANFICELIYLAGKDRK